MPKWEQHLTCKRFMRAHPDWTDEQVLMAAGMRPVEMEIVREARRELSTESETQGVVRSQRPY